MSPIDNISPGLFIQLTSPAWARVYVECSFTRLQHNNRLSWVDDSVKRAFVALSGFDPAKIQYAEIEVQHAALNAARELESALFEADEVEQLDGQPAIEYAMGWMTARDWLAGADVSAIPDEDFTRIQSVRCANASSVENQQDFVNGFIKRVKMGHHYVA